MGQVRMIVARHLDLPPEPIINEDKYLKLIEDLETLLLDEILTIRKELNGRVAFGSPRASEALTGGLVENIEGVWVEATVTSLAAATVFTHNLNCNTVKWIVMKIQHSGAGAPTVPIGLEWRGTATANTISLFILAPGRTVDAPNPIYLTLFFLPCEE